MINKVNEKVILNKKIKKNYDILTHYLGCEEIIISDKLKKILESEDVKGVSYNPIYLTNTSEIVEGYYHLNLKESDIELSDKTVLEKNKYCKECNRYETLLIKSLMYFEKLNDNKDIFYTKEWFGDSSKRTQNKKLIITKKFYNILRKYYISEDEWIVIPALIDDN
jgi:hypothetical protein